MVKKWLLLALAILLVVNSVACDDKKEPSWKQVQVGLTTVISNWNINVVTGVDTDSYDQVAAYIAYRWAVSKHLEAITGFVLEEVTAEIAQKALDFLFPASSLMTEALRGQAVKWLYKNAVEFVSEGREFRSDTVTLTIAEVNELTQHRGILPAVGAPVDDLPGDLVFTDYFIIGYDQKAGAVTVLVIANWGDGSQSRVWETKYEIDSNGLPKNSNQSLQRIDLKSLPTPIVTLAPPTPVSSSTPTGPYIDSIHPLGGAPGIQTTIQGRNFNDVVVLQQVTFGFKSAEIVSWSDTEIIVVVPYGTGTVEVAAGPFPRSNAVSFTYAEPHVANINPASGETGIEVKITGTNFGVKGISPSYWVKFGKSLAKVKSWQDAQIVAEAPTDYGTGENDSKIIEWLVKLAVYGYTADIPGLINDLVKELADSKVKIMPQSGKIEVGITVTTPAGTSYPAVFTYRVETTPAQVLIPAPKVTIKTWYVDDDLRDYPKADFAKIGMALNAASAGDTIIVYPGNYNENLDVTKGQLTIKSKSGANSTIIQALNSNDHVFEIKAAQVNISGFTIQGAMGNDKAGIYSYDSPLSASDLILSKNNNAVYAFSTSQSPLLVSGCTFSGNNRGIYSQSSYGSRYGEVHISNSTFSNNVYGIYTSDFCGVDISNSNFHNNDYGIYGYDRMSIKAEYSIFSNNNYGIYGNSTWGINSLHTNFYDNDYGIYAVNGWDNTLSISYSNFRNNRWGIYYKASTLSSHIIFLNNFTDNTKNVDSSPSKYTWNSAKQMTYPYNNKTYTSYLGNYWSGYSGSDANGDGIGDTPYRINSERDNYPLMKPWGN